MGRLKEVAMHLATRNQMPVTILDAAAWGNLSGAKTQNTLALFRAKSLIALKYKK